MNQTRQQKSNEARDLKRIKDEQLAISAHRRTLFIGGHTNSDRNIEINYDYSEGDIL